MTPSNQTKIAKILTTKFLWIANLQKLSQFMNNPVLHLYVAICAQSDRDDDKVCMCTCIGMGMHIYIHIYRCLWEKNTADWLIDLADKFKRTVLSISSCICFSNYLFFILDFLKQCEFLCVLFLFVSIFSVRDIFH